MANTETGIAPRGFACFIENLHTKYQKIIDSFPGLWYYIFRLKEPDAVVAQSVERRIGSAEVTGSIPVSSSIKSAPEPWFYRVPAFFCFYGLGSTRVDLFHFYMANARSISDSFCNGSTRLNA